MKNWLFVTLIVLILTALVLLVYTPIFLAPQSPPPFTSKHPADSTQRGIEGLLTFCTDVSEPFIPVRGETQSGYIPELLRMLYEPVGFQVELVRSPWGRCLSEALKGDMTGVIGTDPSQAASLVFPTEPLDAYRPQFYTLSESPWVYQDLQNLHEIRLGALRDYSYSSLLNAYLTRQGKSERLVFTQGERGLETLLLALHEGKIDAFVANQFTVDAFLKTRAAPKVKLRIAGSLLPKHKLFVAFNPEADRTYTLATRFDRRIRMLRRNGTLARHLAQHNLTDGLSLKPTGRDGLTESLQ